MDEKRKTETMLQIVENLGYADRFWSKDKRMSPWSGLSAKHKYNRLFADFRENMGGTSEWEMEK